MQADVFMERRSLHDINRNAMVAVLYVCVTMSVHDKSLSTHHAFWYSLRHIEYYRGILFLTTNRIKTFDLAFLSRIHAALHFGELTTSTKAQIWRAFLKRTDIEDVSDELVQNLAERNINGRQIKNACKTAAALALSRREPLKSEYLIEALAAMEQFVAGFAALQGEIEEM